MYDMVLVEREDGERTLTVFAYGEIVTADSTHPRFDELLAATRRGDDLATLQNLADPASLVGTILTPLSERISVGSGRVFFDGDEVHDSIGEHILRFLDEGVEDWQPLVRFLEKLSTNPERHSREQLYDWLTGRAFTITTDGDFVAYKGVMLRDGQYVSQHSGPAIVNGVPMNGHVPNAEGSTIELSRSQVAFDPSTGCASGLHAGTYEYAKMYASGALLKVVINPRDVVSVPTDSDAQKLRVSRYRVVETIDAPETLPVVQDDWYDAQYEREAVGAYEYDDRNDW
jgi:hypothetical protein